MNATQASAFEVCESAAAGTAQQSPRSAARTPQELPAQHVLDVAVRHLPEQPGATGDLFDVIPLPENRVALVAGGIVGHSPRVSTAMGRLRTAVRNLASIDLPPDELLGHLDHLVRGWDEAAPGGRGLLRGATCLYVIYDPVARHCVMARAGHPPPAAIGPDGQVDFPDVPAGPPLGLAGGSYQTGNWEVPDGSQLVLPAKQLIERRGKGNDAGLAMFRGALVRAARNSCTDPDQTCAAVLDAVRPDRAGDGVAFLVARTCGVPPDQIADWDVPTEPAAVAGLRAAVTRQLVKWGLKEIAFTTELILSELINNAIRYTHGPIHLRLLCDCALICEVFDSSVAFPHLRHAATTDEGGRGLFLVERLTDRWGTRHIQAGKVIWAEQPLPGGVRTSHAST